MPNGLDTENRSMARVVPPSSRQDAVAVRIFFLAAKRLSSCPPLAPSSFPAAAVVVVLPVTVDTVKLVCPCSIDLLMVRRRAVPHLQTDRSTTTHMHMKATQATLVAVCECLAADRMVPAKAPMHTTNRVACCPSGRSSALDIAMISGVCCFSRGSFLEEVRTRVQV